MELLDTEVKIDLPSLIVKHMHRVLNQDENGHSLPYGFWLTEVFEDLVVPVQVWAYQTTKDVLGRVEHATLPASMKRANMPLQRLKNALAEKNFELAEVHASHEQDKAALEEKIMALQNELATEKAENAATIHRLTQLLPHSRFSSNPTF